MTRAAALLLGVAATGLVSGCSETVRTGQASSYLVLQRLEGASGADTGSQFQSVLPLGAMTELWYPIVPLRRPGHRRLTAGNQSSSWPRRHRRRDGSDGCDGACNNLLG